MGIRLNSTLLIIVLSLLLVSGSVLLQANIGYSPADEGYLWYGVIQTEHGSIPVRDIQSYEPGRYYWSAFWTSIFGDSILDLHIAVAIFQFLGLALGLLVIRKTTNSWWVLLASAFLLLIWMYPRHKLFDHSISIAGVFFANWLLERPSIRRYFVSGAFVGITAFFGRNHGTYLAVAFFLIALLIWWKMERTQLVRRLLAGAGGILAGYAPILLMMLLIPGFFESLVNDVMNMFRIGSTNLPLPVPWPWAVNLSTGSFIQRIQLFSMGSLFLILPVFYVAAIGLICCQKPDTFRSHKAVIAAIIVGVFYCHYSFSRADLGHLALGILPFIIAVCILPFSVKNKPMKAISIGLLVIVYLLSIYSVGAASPWYTKWSSTPGSYVKTKISGDEVWVHKNTANEIDVFRTINRRVPAGEQLLIVPHRPGMYPVLGRKSPIKETYLIFPATEQRQKEIIMELKKKNVTWAIVGNAALDRREDLRFYNTYPLVSAYLEQNFEIIPWKGLPPDYQVMRRIR